MTSAADTGLQQPSHERRHDFLAALLLIVAVVGTYAVCLTKMVGHADDYWLLWEPAPSLEVWNAAGRWASGLFFQAVWYGADSIDDLWRPRLAALVGIVLFALALYASLRRLGYSWLMAVSVPLLAALLPTFNVYAVWATCAGHVYACLAAILAFWLAEASSSRGEFWRSGALGHLAAGVLFVGFSIYQPAAMFYATLAMMALAARHSDRWDKRAVLRWGIHASVLIAALAASYLTFKLMAREVHDLDIPGRGEFTSDYVKKLGRFVLQPVGQSCLPYFFVNHWEKWRMFRVELGILGVFVPLGLWFRLPGTRRQRALRVVALLALIPVTYLPNLLIASDFFPHRTRPAISVSILFLLLLAAAGHVRWLIAGERMRQRIAWLGLAAAFGIAFAMARYHLRDFFFVPSRIEWEVVCSDIERAIEKGPATPQRVVFIMPDSDLPVAERFIYDEFGYLSASCYWVTEGMTGLAVQKVAPEKLSAFREAEFLYILREHPPPPAQRTDWVITARRLNHRERAKKEAAAHQAAKLPGGVK